MRNLTKTDETFLNLLSASIHLSSAGTLHLNSDEWHEVLTLAQSHNVLPLVFEKVSECEAFTILPEYQSLTVEIMATVAGQARRTADFFEIYREFLKNEIHPIVMKGLICRQLYGELCDHRPSGDEDILIRKSEYEQVCQILLSNGYIPEFQNVTAAQLDELQEITFQCNQNGLTIEVHVNPIGHEDGWRRQMDNYFQNVFQNSREEIIDGVPVTTMGHTDHLLFLILHAFKHLTVGGFGIRQVIDILLYIEKYGNECDWDEIKKVLKHLRAESFFSDLVYIGNKYLGFQLEIPFEVNCPEELLAEILDCGVFGNATQAQRTAIQMTSAAIRGKDEKDQSKIRTLLSTIFPNRAWMISMNPELIEKPYLLPICWVKRWGRFLAHNKVSGGNLAAESMKISKRRIELLKKYDIL